MDEREVMTDAAGETENHVAPAGRRSGRHRFFRSRAASSESTLAADEPTAEATVREPAVEAAAETEPAAEDTAPEETGPTGKRRRWLRRKVDGPVTTEPAPTEPADEAADEEPSTKEDASQEDSEEAKDSTDDQEAGGAPKPRKPVTRAVTVAVAIAAALFVAASAVAASLLQPYLVDRALADTRMEVARTAATAMTVMWTYSPQDMDKLIERSSQYLSGDVKELYVRQVDAQLAASKQLQISRNAQVLGAGVESLNGSNATVVVFVNVSYASATSKNISKRQLMSFRLFMERNGADWVINKMPPITSKDATQIFSS